MAKIDMLLTGLIAGAAIGAVAGLLLTPKTGEETRKLLKERASDLGEKANATVNDIFRR